MNMHVPRTQAVFAFQLESHLQHLLASWKNLNQAIRDPEFGVGNETSTTAWLSLYGLFMAQGTASYLLWPRKKSDSRPRLAKILGVSDSSPLRSREPRNSLVHIDDRLSAWSKKPDVSSSIHHSFGSVASVTRTGMGIDAVMQMIDVRKPSAVVFGQEYELAPMADAAQQIIDSVGTLAMQVLRGEFEGSGR